MVKSVWKGFVTKYSSDIRIAAKEDRIYVLKGGGDNKKNQLHHVKMKPLER